METVMLNSNVQVIIFYYICPPPLHPAFGGGGFKRNFYNAILLCLISLYFMLKKLKNLTDKGRVHC